MPVVIDPDLPDGMDGLIVASDVSAFGATQTPGPPTNVTRKVGDGPDVTRPEKPVVSFLEWHQEQLAVHLARQAWEHQRQGCTECAVGGCISDARDIDATLRRSAATTPELPADQEQKVAVRCPENGPFNIAAGTIHVGHSPHPSCSTGPGGLCQVRPLPIEQEALIAANRETYAVEEARAWEIAAPPHAPCTPTSCVQPWRKGDCPSDKRIEWWERAGLNTWTHFESNEVNAHCLQHPDTGIRYVHRDFGATPEWLTRWASGRSAGDTLIRCPHDHEPPALDRHGFVVPDDDKRIEEAGERATINTDGYLVAPEWALRLGRLARRQHHRDHPEKHVMDLTIAPSRARLLEHPDPDPTGPDVSTLFGFRIEVDPMLEHDEAELRYNPCGVIPFKVPVTGWADPPAEKPAVHTIADKVRVSRDDLDDQPSLRAQIQADPAGSLHVHQWQDTEALVTYSPASHRWCPGCGVLQVLKFSGWADLIRVSGLRETT